MNIREAKTEIKNTVRAYTRKRADGTYCIPAVRQRPVLLIGPPGVGKTAIMEQIAEECGIGLVSYTITHHTRQSAVGLPVVTHKKWQGREYTVTEYTMSEIIASVYECMERTGLAEGILFIDEINCVSETLNPTMLQFLQNKTFGTHAVPKGWVIVAAGNPREYNKSAREFDIVTLDRVKRIQVEADLNVWREYAMEKNFHPAILGYLRVRPQQFYRVFQTAGDKRFVTARGWEDLSVMLQNYEEMGVPADETLVLQYLQDPETAADFAAYYSLYQKYEEDYEIRALLDGELDPEKREKKITLAKKAGADERLLTVDLILGCWNGTLEEYDRQGRFTQELSETLRREKEFLKNGETPEEFLKQFRCAFQIKRENRLFSQRAEALEAAVLKTLETCLLDSRKRHEQTPEEFLETAYRLSRKETKKCETLAKRVKQELARGFAFAGEAYGKGTETMLLAADLAANPLGAKFLQTQGCAEYFAYSDSLQLGQERRRLQKEIADSFGIPSYSSSNAPV